MASPTWFRHESLASKGCVMHSTNTRRSYRLSHDARRVIDEAALTSRMAEVRARLKSYT